MFARQAFISQMGFGAFVFFAQILDETPRGLLFALQNSGVPPLKAFTYTLLPQAFRDWLSYVSYRFECAIRAAAVLGIIGAGGLGRALTDQLSAFDYQAVLTTLIVFVGLIFLVDMVSAAARRTFR